MYYRKEEMNNVFTKHVADFEENDSRHIAIHHFTGLAPIPHDHPFGFRSTILKGSYIERVYHINPDGSFRTEDVHRQEGSSHYVPASCIHEIISLPDGDCWTLTVLEPHQREWRFWDFREDGIYSRQHNEEEFTPYKTIILQEQEC